jgi:hypothetical protein
MVVLLARLLVDRRAALVTGLVYLAGGYVFTQGFSFRSDPIATAVLMSALYLFARFGRHTAALVLVGALVGLAGLMTIKSIFYAPCFAAFALWRLMDVGEKLKEAARIAIVPLIALATFVAVLQFHRVGLAPDRGTNFALGSGIGKFLGDGPGSRTKYIYEQAALAPLITIGLAISAFVWRRMERREAVACAGLLTPLLSLLVYRNTFPYFFVFLMAPVCVGIAPSIGVLLARYRLKWLLPIIALAPLYLLARERYDVVDRQRALIAEVHRLFPEPTGYLAYGGIIADYPRILPHLISGVGLQGYRERGVPVIANAIARGEVAFVIADSPPVKAGLEGRQLPDSLFPRDFAMLRANFLHYGETIWIAGKMVCPAAGEQGIEILRGGPYAVDGGLLRIDGVTIADGQALRLARGRHAIEHESGACVRMWALPAVPRLPPDYPRGRLMTEF